MNKNTQCVVWEFRANLDYYELDDLINFMNLIGKKWVFQHEKGEKTGYDHWQGRLSLHKIKRKSELLKLIQGTEYKVPNYLEPTTNNEFKKEAFYCMKADTRIAGPYKNTDKSAYIPVQYRNIELYPYQTEILESRLKMDFRTVNLVVDVKGNVGKSTIASIADLMYGGIDLPPMNDGEKIIQSCCNILMAKEERKPSLIFFDMPRSIDKAKLGGMFGAIEQIKKGKVYDTRHSYTEWWFDSPAVWVFTNQVPNLKYLSIDRWKFWRINDSKELVQLQKSDFTEQETGPV